jgi:mannose-1-phosphate guanylyltransferase
MKAFLLAAGAGTRLRPLTEELPKCLLPIQGVPLLHIWLESCRASGINEVLINVHAHAGKIKDFIFANRYDTMVHIAEEPDLLGSAGTLVANSKFVASEKEFFILYGDVLTDANMSEMLADHHRSGQPTTLAIHQVDDPTKCGIVVTDSRNVIQQFVEKPQQPASNWAFSGLMITRPEVIQLVPQQRPADIGFHLLPKLVGNMNAYKLNGFLLDIGTLNSYRAAQDAWPGLRTTSSVMGN